MQDILEHIGTSFAINYAITIRDSINEWFESDDDRRFLSESECKMHSKILECGLQPYFQLPFVDMSDSSYTDPAETYTVSLQPNGDTLNNDFTNTETAMSLNEFGRNLKPGMYGTLYTRTLDDGSEVMTIGRWNDER